MKVFKVIAFFGNIDSCMFFVNYESMSKLKKSLEFCFLKTPWLFLVAPTGRTIPSYATKPLNNCQEISDYLHDFIKSKDDLRNYLELQKNELLFNVRTFRDSLIGDNHEKDNL